MGYMKSVRKDAESLCEWCGYRHCQCDVDPDDDRIFLRDFFNQRNQTGARFLGLRTDKSQPI